MTAETFRTIWLDADDPSVVKIIDQRLLPHEFKLHDLGSWQDAETAIADMYVRGAPLIGATAAWGLYLAALESPESVAMHAVADRLLAARPTAVNLRWAIERIMRVVDAHAGGELADEIRRDAQAICDEDVEISRGIGEHGVALLEAIAARKPGEPVNVLTHCNAGALATINYGTATAPVYIAQQRGIDVHVWVDETRPRNQGSQLTAWELAQSGVPHTLIVDNAGGHLMQHGLVDIVIVGTDRTTRCGDVANKIGTYLKALAAFDNDIPFYVGLPSTTIDWRSCDGVAEIPIEERDAEEVSHVHGMREGAPTMVRTTAPGTPISNYAFDVTPARLVTGLITERGICAASEDGLLGLFPEMRDRS
ncbi:MAG: S-methyl-5-thioribose-1-phosphate isomerase [Gammaproteobacteria bacterium]|nr:S-methyl-5-thioribose-1-phosphate isomerase [Gammaproteobacteria bacterium]NNF49365.1 S-methyl-5-thioribose-1-phosphate isomerase [Woeseiaceae bacterium]MBT8093562.1 S-methyl-5-thioribose-1-phosphate isomerase [Gammaproteobacteria bacterium]MBT8106474.1 S-methyl-5-thioribose-1-phosphate isomerase [Gammaproteobacteria bacterium]NNK26489.1 S-methyl-5-thioribose-1-phosphate isomerase [Woeseiaceae bacterium]